VTVNLFVTFGALTMAVWPFLASAAPVPRRNQSLRVGVAGTEPFVVESGGTLEGISVEIWQALAAQAAMGYEIHAYENVPHALDALTSGKLDLVVGPVSITAERAQFARFSQPYFESSLSILSRADSYSLWQRVAPFFDVRFFYAVGILLVVLTLVGTLVWLAERREPDTHFPRQPGRGVANGIWFAIVTMSTVGYGDLAPRTRMGRLVTGVWILISIIMASSLVAGIASTLTLAGMTGSVISTAEQLTGKTVAVLANSPGEVFARNYGGRLREVETLQQGYELLKRRAVDAVVFDRPQLLYFLQQQHESSLVVSNAEYMPQKYGFAMPLSSNLVHPLNVTLLQLEESGRVSRIVRAWLGEHQE
jgi:polar amino acid transport system substrate-binding protein